MNAIAAIVASVVVLYAFALLYRVRLMDRSSDTLMAEIDRLLVEARAIAEENRADCAVGALIRQAVDSGRLSPEDIAVLATAFNVKPSPKEQS